MISLETMFPSYNTLQLSFSDGVLEVALNRPKKMNAMSGEMFREICDVFTRLQTNYEVSVVVKKKRQK